MSVKIPNVRERFHQPYDWLYRTPPNPFFQSILDKFANTPITPLEETNMEASIALRHCVHCGRVYAETSSEGTEECVCGAELYPIARTIKPGEIFAGDGARIRVTGACSVYRGFCSLHGFVHGAEAEELRRGLEALIEKAVGNGKAKVSIEKLQKLLDSVDARDSVAHLEASDASK